MNPEILSKITSFYERNPTLKGKPATDEDILNAEKELNICFDNEYKNFIKRFGGAYAGLAIHAFINGSSIGNETIIELTDNARKLFNNAKIFPEINKSLVIADDGSGNPIAIEPNGQIILFDYDSEEKQILSNSFKELIEDNIVEW